MSGNPAAPPMLTPRWAPNGLALGGVGLLAGGVLLAGLPLMIAGVRREAGWLALMGVVFLVAGGAWAWLAGRWGLFRDSARAAREGVPGRAVIVAVRQTTVRRKRARRSGSGMTTHRVLRLDLDVEAAGIAGYRLRVHRNLPVRLLGQATVGRRLGVRLLPDRPRGIALEWPEPDPVPPTTLTITRHRPGWWSADMTPGNPR